MNRVREAVAELLAVRGEFSAAELGQCLGITRQAAWKHAEKLVRLGELQRHNRNPRGRYGPGRKPGFQTGRVESAREFWHELALRVGTEIFRYVQVLHVGTANPRQASQAELLLSKWDSQSFVILDFTGVVSVTESFISALLRGGYNRRLPINMSPAVAQVVHLVLMMSY